MEPGCTAAARLDVTQRLPLIHRRPQGKVCGKNVDVSAQAGPGEVDKELGRTECLATAHGWPNAEVVDSALDGVRFRAWPDTTRWDLAVRLTR